MKKIMLVSLLAFVVLFNLSAGAMADDAEKKFRLKMPIAAPSKLPVVALVQDFVKNVELASNGTIQIKIYEPGALIPAFEIQEAVSKGRVQCGWGATSYIMGQIPEAIIFNSLPFGPTSDEYRAWYYYGNGMKLWNEMYAERGYNIQAWPMLLIQQESGGWFRKPINSVADIKGLRLRWAGLSGKALSNLGASVSTMPAGEIFPALEKGAIDGAELSSPVIDKGMGFWKVCKYNYFPGWHVPSTVMEFVMNKDIWNSMSKRQQAVINMAVSDVNNRSLAWCDAAAGKILKENAAHGVNNMVWSPELLKAFKEAWEEVLAEMLAEEPRLRKIWEDLTAFQKEYAVWKHYSAIPDELTK